MQTQTEVQILDKGYVRFIESMGSDQRVVENARQSTSSAFKGWGPIHEDNCPNRECREGSCAHDGHFANIWDGRHCDCKLKPGDEKLLNYLWKNGHISPFECCAFTVEMQAPIFVFRQLFRHRSLSPNEYSGRYTSMLDINYLPTIDRLMIDSDGVNKQAGTIKDAAVLTLDNAEWFRAAIYKHYLDGQEIYEKALKVGIPKELARIHLSVAGYSRARISGNLRNWLSVIDQRSDHAPKGLHAQWETRQFINPVGNIIANIYPKTWAVYKVNQ